MCFSTQDGFSGAQGAGEAPPASTDVDFDEMKSLISPRLRYCQVAGSASFSNREQTQEFVPVCCLSRPAVMFCGHRESFRARVF